MIPSYSSQAEGIKDVVANLPPVEQYTDQLCIMREEDPKLPYFPRRLLSKSIVKWGQLKLLLTEMTALMFYAASIPDPIVVYAGASPGHHINLLIEFFPQMKWVLYDPKPISVQESDRVKVFQVSFTDSIAKSYARLNNVVFITDIRTGSHTNRGFKHNEREIWNDMLDQKRWVELMKPRVAHIKFRLPYVDVSDQTTFTSTYFSGTIFYQPFAGASSTECRLVVVPQADGNYKTITYDNKAYEDRCFYRNAVLRESQVYKDNIIGSVDVFDSGEMDNRIDSRMMLSTFWNYLKKSQGNSFLSQSSEDQYAQSVAISSYARKFISSYRQEPVSLSIIRQWNSTDRKLPEEDEE